MVHNVQILWLSGDQVKNKKSSLIQEVNFIPKKIKGDQVMQIILLT